MKFSSFKNWLSEEKTQSKKLEYGCIMLYADIPNSSKHISIIDKEDIYDDEFHDFGLEKTPHVTVLFGIHLDETTPDDIKQFMKTFKPVNVTIDKISVFEASKDKDYDVVKYDVPVTKELQMYHDFVLKRFPNTQTFPDYHPHMTICYVLPGKGKKYAGKVKPFKVIFDKAVYSYANGNKKERINVNLSE
jgi:2'-5' RNA ligase